MIVLTDITNAPTAGGKTMPTLYNTPAAKGMAKTLYPVAQARFCFIFLRVAFDSFTISTTFLGAGFDSPVSIDSSISDSPSVISPSTGIRS